MKRSGIYRIEGPSGWIYVGQSTNIPTRWANHRSQLRRGIHSNQHMQHAWNKYGEAAFRFVIVEPTGVELLSQREQHHVDAALATGLCYNKAPIADPPRGWRHSEQLKAEARERATGVKPSAEARARMSAAQLRREPLSPEAKADVARKISAAHRGKVVSAETRALIRLVQLGKKQTAESNQKRANTMRGQQRSAETRQRQSAIAIARSQDAEYIKKLSAAGKRRAADTSFIEMAKRNLPDTGRRVECSDGRRFASFAEAGRCTGIPKHRIQRWCHGTMPYPTDAILRFKLI